MRRLKFSYELASERIIESRYSLQLLREKEKAKREEKERLDELPDYVAAWEMSNKEDEIKSVMLEDNPSNFLGYKNKEEKMEKPEESSHKKTLENKYLPAIVDSETVYANNMPEVHWYGHFTSYGGFSRMNRAFAFGLANRGVRVKTDIQKCNVEVNDATKRELEILSQNEINEKSPKVFGATLPLNMLHGGRKILYTMMETSETLHKEYVDRINLFDEVWVPTYYGADVFKKNGVSRPIFVMPLGVDTIRYNEKTPEYPFGDSVNEFVFLSVFKWGYRKGYDILLKAYMDEFSSQDNVSLVLLTRAETDPNPNRISEDFNAIRGGIDKQDDDLPHIAFYTTPFSEKDMPKVYRASDAFVLISRGEGFGLPYYEAAACGLPIIGSICSGQQDLLDNENVYKVNPDTFTKAKINGPLSKLAKHCRFYEDQTFPDFGEEAILQTRKHMRDIYENQNKAKKKAKVMMDLVQKEYSWDMAVERVLNRINEIRN